MGFAEFKTKVIGGTRQWRQYRSRQRARLVSTIARAEAAQAHHH